ncbi:hypothetical protein DMH08_15730 [Actinomadura sp. WAC 06369]|nr:hypothetical protein DMH08_15730 [Actinomadura sp. WAC 06369]
MIRRVIELAALVVEIGLLGREHAHVLPSKYASIGPETELCQTDLLDWLQEFGMAVSMHCDDVDDLEQAYKPILSKPQPVQVTR